MDDFLSLKILDKFRSLFEKFGIDYNLMRAILKTKLTLDSRAVSVLNQNNKKNSESTSIIKRYLLHLIFGVFLAFFVYFIKDEMIRMIYLSGALFFMTTMYLISDFSFVLLDTKDKNILLTRPVDGRTVSLSKLLHILIYMFRLNIFIAGPSLIAIVKINGAAAIPIFIMEIVLMDLLIFLVTAYIYLLVLKFFDGEFLRNIINLIQILLTVLVTVGYQIAVRMIDFTDLQNITYTFNLNNYFNPILWFGAPFEIVFNGGRDMYLYIFTVLLITVPLISFIFYLRLSKRMESLLLKLESEGKEKPKKHRIEFIIGRLLNRNEISRQAYYFSNAVLRSDRSLKLRIYPSLSTGILFPVIMIFNMSVRGQQYNANGFEYLYMYFSFTIIPSVFELLQFSSACKGSYTYLSSGFDNTRQLYKGLLQSAAIRLVIPLLMLNGAVYIFLFKERFLADIIVLILSGIAIMPVIGRIHFEHLPFSRPVDESNQGKPIDKYIMSIGVIICFIIPHVIFRNIPMGIWIYTAIMTAGIFVSWSFVPIKNVKLKS